MKNNKVIIDTYGSPEVLKIQTESMPQPKANQLRIKVLRTGVAYGDVLMRKGVLPGNKKAVLGFEVLGIVDTVGVKSTKFEKGMLVAAMPIVGGYSEYICLHEDELVAVSDQVDLSEATAIILNYVTAWQILHRTAKVKAGDSILIQGASGGLGTALLELGKIAKLKMYGTASAKKHGIVKQLGGHPLDYKTDYETTLRQLEPSGVDFVVDGVGEQKFKRSYDTLKRGGKLISVGWEGHTLWSMLSSAFVFFSRNLLPDGKRSVAYAIILRKNRKLKEYKTDLKTLFDLHQAGKIKPIVHQVMPLFKVAEAHQLLESGAVTGKLILSTGA